MLPDGSGTPMHGGDVMGWHLRHGWSRTPGAEHWFWMRRRACESIRSFVWVFLDVGRCGKSGCGPMGLRMFREVAPAITATSGRRTHKQEQQQPTENIYTKTRTPAYQGRRVIRYRHNMSHSYMTACRHAREFWDDVSLALLMYWEVRVGMVRYRKFLRPGGNIKRS